MKIIVVPTAVLLNAEISCAVQNITGSIQQICPIRCMKVRLWDKNSVSKGFIKICCISDAF